MPLGEEVRLLSFRVLQNFVRETSGKWDEEDWRQLIERIRRIGFFKIEGERIRRLVDDNRERWLAGDNGVGSAASTLPQSIFAPKPGGPAFGTGPLSGPLAEKPKATDDVMAPEMGTISETQTVGAQAKAFGLTPVPAAGPDPFALRSPATAEPRKPTSETTKPKKKAVQRASKKGAKKPKKKAAKKKAGKRAARKKAK